MKSWARASMRSVAEVWQIEELRVLAVAVLIAVGAVTSVGFFTDRVERAMSRQASVLLGADLVVSSPDPIREQIEALANQNGLESARTVSFPSVVLHGDQTQLTEVKAVTAGYPLRGRVRIAETPFADEVEVTGVPQPGEVWVDLRLLQRLQMNVKDRLQLGERSFSVGALLAYEPDRGGDLFQLAPRILLNISDLESTGLVTPASRVQYRFLAAGEERSVDRFRDDLVGRLRAGERVQGISEARPELSAALERAQQFLGLAALVAVLLAGSAIAVAARLHVERQADATAIMRCLGASRAYVLRAAAGRLVRVALIGGVVGCAVGFIAHDLLARTIGSWFLSEMAGPTAWPVLSGLATGIVTVLGFALPSTLNLGRVPPLRVLRRELTAPPASAWFLVMVALITMAGLLLWTAGDATLAGWVLAGAAAMGLILWLTAWGLVRGLVWVRGYGGLLWRVGLAALARHPSVTAVQLAGFGLGIMALLVLAVVRVDLLSAWQRTLPAEAPNHFLINVQEREVARLRQLFVDRGISAPEFFPMVRGRLAAVNGTPISPEQFSNDRAQRLVAREFNLSWALDLQDDNRIVDGQWWHGRVRHRDQLSVEEGLAKTLGIGLGDRLRFTVAGQELNAEVTSLRSVQWDSLRVNFFVISPPGLLDGYPVTYITSFYLPEGRTEVLTELIRAFPSVTVLNVRALMAQVRAIMDRASLAVEYVFVFTLLAGLVVLYAAIQSSRDARIRDTAVLRTLGARRWHVFAGLLVEFCTLGLVAGLLAALGATALGGILAERIFGLSYVANPLLWLLGAGAGAVGVGLAGVMGTRSVLNLPPLHTLKNL